MRFASDRQISAAWVVAFVSLTLAGRIGAASFETEERMAARFGKVAGNGAALSFADDPRLAEERYEIRAAGAGRVVIAGSTRRARLYGLGRHLRDAAFRGGSEPAQKRRGIYLATHFGNWYETAPEQDVLSYVEDLVLWGCNQVRVWFDAHAYSGIDDPAAQPLICRLRGLLKAARDCGVETSLIALSNEAFATSPESIRADWRSGQNGYTRDLCGHYHVEICPSRPGGLDLILKTRKEILGMFKDCGVGEVAFFSYDQGGCTCSGCAPWGCNGMLKVLPRFSELVKRTIPGCRVEFGTWYFDRFGPALGEWKGIKARIGEVARHADGLAVENLDAIRDGAPGCLPATTMPEISMRGMLPWGGFGANPQPRRFAAEFRRPGAECLTGFRPYSEGVYEDLNKVLVLAWGWDPSTSVEMALGEYAAFYFGENARKPVTEAVLLLEQNLGHKAYFVQDGKRWNAYQGGRIDGKRPFALAFGDHKPQAERAARALALLKPLEATAGNSWRWRILLLRAEIDDGLAKGRAIDSPELTPAFDELRRVYRVTDQTEPFLTPPGTWLDPTKIRAGTL